MPLPDDLRIWLERHFDKNSAGSAAALLDSAVDHLNQPAGPRLQRCAAFASGGNIGRLQQLVDLMRIDYRDVIVAGEYDTSTDDWRQVRDFNKPMLDD